MAEGVEEQGEPTERLADGALDRAALQVKTLAELRTAWEGYVERLPADHEDWPRGAVYVRESSAQSLTRESPLTQIGWVLDQFAREAVWAEWDDVYFDNVSGTSVSARPAFKRMYEAAMRGAYTVIAAHRSDRLFRNAADARSYRADLRAVGVELEHSGRLRGDPRSISSWMTESQQDLMDEFWARKSSESIGLELERLSRSGRPIGRLPEGYMVGRRAASFNGTAGKILSYVRREPLASLIVQAKDRYLAGDSYQDLAVWSATTELKGVTPSGAVMNLNWWRGTLTNPKYAGSQMPSTWQGFRPGKGGTPRRPRRKNLITELVPCDLPALYRLEDWQKIVEKGRARQQAAKARAAYRVCLLSSIAIDDRCGHRMGIQARYAERIVMVCQKVDVTGRHSNPMRIDLAERALDALCANLRLDDPTLLAMVEQELDDLTRREAATPTFRPDPELGRVTAALAALGDDAPSELRAPLLALQAKLEALDEAHRSDRHEASHRFRASVDDLRSWQAIWTTGDMKAKNDVLKAAGVRVRLARPAGASRGPAQIVSIEAADPVFALALALAAANAGYQGPNPSEPRNATPSIRLPGELATILDAALGKRRAA